MNFKSQSAIEESLIITLFDVVNYLTKNSETIALQGGLTVQQWLVLLQIADDSQFPQPVPRPRSPAAGTHASEIAEARGVSRPAISSLVAALLRKGLVQQRENPEDRRRKTLHITSKGLSALEKIEPLRQNVNATFFRDFSESEMTVVHSFLRRWLARLWHLEELKTVTTSPGEEKQTELS